MENRQIALLLFALTLIIAFIAWSYDNALNEIVNTQCTHGLSCPMHATIDAQRNLAISVNYSQLSQGASCFNDDLLASPRA